VQFSVEYSKFSSSPAAWRIASFANPLRPIVSPLHLAAINARFAKSDLARRRLILFETDGTRLIFLLFAASQIVVPLLSHSTFIAK